MVNNKKEIFLSYVNKQKEKYNNYILRSVYDKNMSCNKMYSHVSNFNILKSINHPKKLSKLRYKYSGGKVHRAELVEILIEFNKPKIDGPVTLEFHISISHKFYLASNISYINELTRNQLIQEVIKQKTKKVFNTNTLNKTSINPHK
jgi:hypothetical protein